MTVGAADIVAPVLATTEVVVFIFASVAGQACLGDRLRRLVRKGEDLRFIALLNVCFTRAMTLLAASHFALPGPESRELGMRGMREVLELIFVAVLARIAADVVIADVNRSDRRYVVHRARG